MLRHAEVVIAVRSQFDGDLLAMSEALEDGRGVLGGELAERCHVLQREARLAGAIENTLMTLLSSPCSMVLVFRVRLGDANVVISSPPHPLQLVATRA